MRLIDADELMEEICEQWFLDILLTQNDIHSLSKNLKDKIDKQPTAYDVDRVVEELKNAKCSRSFECAEFRQKAIEIVKAGGVDEIYCR